MATKRAGVPDAPSQIVSVINPGNPVADTSMVWRALGQAARSIGEKVQPTLNQMAQRQASEDFVANGARQRVVINAEDEYYNNAMEQLYATKASMDIDTLMDGLEAQHPVDGDVEAFDNSVLAARTRFIGEAAPAFAPQAGALFDRAHLSARQRIGERRRSLAIEQLQQNGGARLSQLESRLSGFTDLTSEEYRSVWNEYEQTGNALSANPLSGMFEDEWQFRREGTLSRLTANSMQYTAEQIYEDGGGNAESAEAALALLEDGMNNPALTLNEAQRDAFFGEGRRRILGRERERLSALREARAEMRVMRGESRDDARDTLAEFAARTEAFSVIPEDELQDLRDTVMAADSASLTRQYNELVITNDYRRRVQGAPLTAIELYNDQLQAEVTANGPEAGDAAIRLRAGRDYVDHIRRGDPLTVAQQHLGESPPPLFSPTGDFQPEALAPRIRFAENAAQELGAETPVYLSPGEREAIAGAVRSGGEQGMAAVRSLVAAAFSQEGDGFQRAQAILHEVATRGDDALLAAGTVFLLGGESSATTSRYIMEAQRLRNIDGYQRPNLPQDGEGRVRESRIDSYLGNRGGFLSPEMRAQLRRSSDLVFEGMVAGGAEPTQNTYDAAVRSSLGSVTRQTRNGVHRFGGVARGRRSDEHVVIPNWIRNDQFATVRASLTNDDYARAGGMFTPRTGNVREWRDSYLVWTGEPGKYWLAQQPDGTGHYEAAPGVPYVLDFNLIRSDSAPNAGDGLSSRRPDAVVR